MVRSETPIISAASHHFKLPAIAFNITSCTFIIRSISANGTACSGFTPQRPIRVKRTDHVLIAPDKSHANNIRRHQRLSLVRLRCTMMARMNCPEKEDLQQKCIIACGEFEAATEQLKVTGVSLDYRSRTVTWKPT